MATINVTCPECQANLKIPDTIAPGKKIRCPKCKATFVLPVEEEEIEPAVMEPANPRAKASAPRKQSPPEPIDEDEEGAFRPAPKKGPGRVPAEGGDRTRSPERKAQPSEDLDDMDEDDRPVRKEGKGSKKGGSALLLWGLVLGGALLLAGGGVALYFLVLKPGMEEKQVKKGLPSGKDRKGEEKGQGGWVADPALVGQLAPETTLQGHKIQPPKGYTREQKPVGQGQQYLWKGPQRPDQSFPSLIMSYLPIGPDKPTLQQVFTIQVDTIRKSLSGPFPTITTSPPEYDKINGLDFVRSRLTLSNADKTLKLQGFVYLTIDGPSGFLFMSTDLDKNNASLKVHEASVQTFKK